MTVWANFDSTKNPLLKKQKMFKKRIYLEVAHKSW